LQGRADKAEARFFVRQGDHVDGPHPRSRILEWHREGKLPDDVLLSPDGQTWHRVRWEHRAAALRPGSRRPPAAR
jgi:hypothetical protein